jgi:hypothetical protein
MKATNLCITMLLIYIACFLSVYARAEEGRWELYYASPDGTKHYYDSKSITRSSRGHITTPQRRIKTPKGYSRVWIVKVKEKIIFNNPDYELKESLILREFDCSKKKVRMLMKSESYKNGSQKIEGKTCPWKNIDSEPFYENLYEIVCPS